jgi:phage antirepressor YoqD-like protein
VDRWAKLEAEAIRKPVLPDFTNPVIAARAWADAEEGRHLAETAAKQLEATVQVQAEQLGAVEPKVRFHDAVGATTDSLKVEVIAKTLGYGRNTFYGLLRDEKILMYSDGGHVPYQSHAAHFIVKYQPYQRADGDRGTRPTSYVTGLGVLYLTRRFGKRVAR